MASTRRWPAFAVCIALGSSWCAGAEADDRPACTPRTFVNSLGMTFVRIEPGSFTTGSAKSDDMARPSDLPVHTVRLTRPFLIGQHEVTLGQFRRFCTETGYKAATEGPRKNGTGLNEFHVGDSGPQYSWRKWGAEQTDAHPVANVTWYDATEFCRWLSKRDGCRCRLPTEAEWEYCCRAGTKTRFSFGDDRRHMARYGNVLDRDAEEFMRGAKGEPYDDGFPTTAPVGRFLPNAFGIFDMHGNVAEWCHDTIPLHRKAPAPREYVDPQGPQRNVVEDRGIRGGSWYNDASHARSASGFYFPQDECDMEVGFRCMIELRSAERD